MSNFLDCQGMSAWMHHRHVIVGKLTAKKVFRSWPKPNSGLGERFPIVPCARLMVRLLNEQRVEVALPHHQFEQLVSRDLTRSIAFARSLIAV
jgi:hypothetical protein